VTGDPQPHPLNLPNSPRHHEPAVPLVCVAEALALSHSDHTYVEDLRLAVDAPATKTVESLKETARDYIKSCPEFKSWGGDVDDIDFAALRVSRQHTPIEPPSITVACCSQREKLGRLQLVLLEMADGNQLNDNSTLASTTVLGTLGDSSELVFFFGALFQLPLKQFPHLAYRELVVSFRIVSNRPFVPQVSHGRKGNCALHAEGGCYQESRSGPCEGPHRLNSGN
jgi:hypothetical protein